jgi:hypothetical protein
MAYKPDFVWGYPLDDHSSRRIVTNTLKLPTRVLGLERPCERYARTHNGPHVRPLFGIAPSGACRAACVAARAVSSYLTVSPLPPI